MLHIDIQKNIDTENGPKVLDLKACFNLGGIHGIFGNSGQGKTTLFDIISGILEPDSGEIIYNEIPWYNRQTKLKIQKRGIGYIFQGNSLFPNFTVSQNILFALPAKERAGVQLAELLEQVGLNALGDKYPSQLSGGQRQRAVIARLLVQKPKLILMDEPFTGLDFEIKHALFRQLRALRDKYDLTVLLVTHDVEDILYLCDSVHIIKDYRMSAPMELPDFKKYIKERITAL